MTIIRLICSSAFIGLSACGGGGGNGGEGGGNTPEPSAFFFGSTDAGASANGLDFADNRTERDDITDNSPQVRLVRFTRNDETGEIRIDTIDEQVSFTDDDEIATITFNGETLVFENGVAIDGNGNELGSTFEALSETIVVGVGNSSEFLFGTENPAGSTFAVGIAGAETNPDQIAALTGQVSYDGAIAILGNVLDQDGQTLADQSGIFGTLSLAVDFGANTVSGSGEFFKNDDLPDFDIAVTETTIQGNGFATDLTMVNCADGFTCSADAEIAGVFLGDQAANLSGIAGGEFSTFDADGNGTTFVGAGVFATGNEDNPIGVVR